MKKKILWGVLALLVIIQFFRIDKTNPTSDPAKDFIAMTNPPAEVAGMIKASCYDCHSNQSVYPWYTNVAPVSWFIKKHINEGRKHLNFSEWGNYEERRRNHKLEEFYGEVNQREMPLQSYLIIHSESRLTDEQVKKMTDWIVEIGGEGVKGEGEEE
ncbi:MAG: heme-binding domain-containing protein [Saprospiraceae bacterium]|nr:heme-binding domain-containing protein [Saprospiraceae bacterium]MCB9326216.1 heme-binding domain-containing protein [Lewinellaceae bacterium]